MEPAAKYMMSTLAIRTFACSLNQYRLYIVIIERTTTDSHREVHTGEQCTCGRQRSAGLSEVVEPTPTCY